MLSVGLEQKVKDPELALTFAMLFKSGLHWRHFMPQAEKEWKLKICKGTARYLLD